MKLYKDFNQAIDETMPLRIVNAQTLHRFIKKIIKWIRVTIDL